jgi:hypothetical protein
VTFVGEAGGDVGKTMFDTLHELRDRVVSGDGLTDQQLIEAVLRHREDKKTAAANLKRAEADLEERLRSRSGRTIETEEWRATLGPKMQTIYDQEALVALPGLVGDSVIWSIIISDQPKSVLSELADRDPLAAEVIESAARRVEGDQEQVKIKARKQGRAKR